MQKFRRGWSCFVAFAAVVIACASIGAGASSATEPPPPAQTIEASFDLPVSDQASFEPLPDDQAWLSLRATADPLDCTDHVATPALEQPTPVT